MLRERLHRGREFEEQLVLLCGPDGIVVDFDLVSADTPEREAGLALLERQPLQGQLVLCDKGSAGREFERAVAELGALVPGRLLGANALAYVAHSTTDSRATMRSLMGP